MRHLPTRQSHPAKPSTPHPDTKARPLAAHTAPSAPSPGSTLAPALGTRGSHCPQGARAPAAPRRCSLRSRWCREPEGTGGKENQPEQGDGVELPAEHGMARLLVPALLSPVGGAVPRHWDRLCKPQHPGTHVHAHTCAHTRTHRQDMAWLQLSGP